MLTVRNLDDQDLFDKIQKGDHHAFSELYYRYHAPIYAYLLKVIKIPALAEDLVQEVFVRLWEARERITIKISFERYLYRISRNMAYRKLTSIAKDRKLQKAIIGTITNEIDSTAPLRAKAYEQLLDQAVKDLPPQRQRVFQLCRVEGMSYAEVSQLLGISHNTIKQHMTEAMRSIKEFLHKNGDIVLAILLFSQLD